jgi:hypothetical protein
MRPAATPSADNLRDAAINRFASALDAYPPGVRGNRLNLLFVEDASPIRSAADYLRGVSGMALQEERREYLAEESVAWPFPSLSLGCRPNPARLSEVLFERFDIARERLIVQRDLGRIVQEQAARTDAEIVALMVVDGLSYYDLPDSEDIMPCLVDGVTTTEYGYREVMGHPPISHRLFNVGYRSQLALTYFDPGSNVLAADLHVTFGQSQIVRITTFEEGLERIRAARMRRGYIQITAPGLDGLCHHHRDRPPRQHYLEELLARFDTLVAELSRHDRRILCCLTADHGILWREHLGSQAQIASGILPEDAQTPRYIQGAIARDFARVRSCGRQSYSLFRYPYLSRPLKRTEWGVHGGISAWESIVPLVVRTR